MGRWRWNVPILQEALLRSPGLESRKGSSEAIAAASLWNGDPGKINGQLALAHWLLVLTHSLLVHLKLKKTNNQQQLKIQLPSGIPNYSQNSMEKQPPWPIYPWASVAYVLVVKWPRWLGQADHADVLAEEGVLVEIPVGFIYFLSIHLITVRPVDSFYS